jgi:MFS family permease
MMVPGGRLGDRFGAGRVIAAALAWIAAANLALAFAGAYWQLLFLEGVCGHWDGRLLRGGRALHCGAIRWPRAAYRRACSADRC